MASTEELDAIVKELDATVQLRPESRKSERFQTFAEMKAFFDKEHQFWSPKGLSEISSGFTTILTSLAQASSNSPVSAKNNIRAALSQAGTYPRLIYSDAALGTFLAKMAQSNLAVGAHAYLTGNIQSRFNEREYLRGLFAAMLFEQPAIVSENLAAQVEAFSSRRQEIDQYKDAIASYSQAFKADTESWIAKIQADVDAQLAADQLSIQEKLSAFEVGLGEWKKAFEESHRQWTEKVQALENAYSEKLRLEKPAKYWQVLVKYYECRGYIWSSVSALVVVALSSMAYHLVYSPPALLNDKEFTLGGFKGAVILTAGLSVVIYLLNLFVRLATSSFHLASDARERLQLTHVFLALLKEKGMEEKDRQIVLSALFSRSDTGLLKYDASPSMPTPLGTILDSFKK